MAKNIKGPDKEGQTPLDDLSGLLPGLRTRKELDEAEYANTIKAHAKYLLMKPNSRFNPFTYESFCHIHKDMFGEVWSWAGEKRRSPKNLGAPVIKIGSEIHRFLFDLHQWEEEKMPTMEIAARIHHRLVQIHPFENGNGRWARLVANIYLHRKGLPLIEWPTDRDFVRNVFKPRYLAALRSADRNDYGLLVKLHEEFAGKNLK